MRKNVILLQNKYHISKLEATEKVELSIYSSITVWRENLVIVHIKVRPC